MNKTVHYIGLDVHKETIAVAIAPAENTEVRSYGIINGTLEALDKLIKKPLVQSSRSDWPESFLASSWPVANLAQ